MTVFDYIVIAVLTVSLIFGFWRGMASEVLALAAWILAFILSRRLGQQAGDFLLTGVDDPMLRSMGGWVLAFVGVLFLMAICRHLLRGLIRAIGLGMADRVFGLIFGFGRGTLIVLLLVAVAGMTPLPQQAWWKNALLATHLEKAVAITAPWLPTEIQSRIRFN